MRKLFSILKRWYSNKKLVVLSGEVILVFSLILVSATVLLIRDWRQGAEGRQQLQELRKTSKTSMEMAKERLEVLRKREQRERK